AALSAKRSNGGAYFLPTSSLAASVFSIVSVVPSFFSSPATSCLATTSFFWSASFAAAPFALSGSPLTIAYSYFGFTAAYMFDGSVHGVVVQTRSAVLGSSTSGNATKTDGSSTSLYPRPTSAEESAVPPWAHHQTTL